MDVAALLETLSLSHLQDVIGDSESVQWWCAVNDGLGRPALLAHFKQLGVGKLAERQSLVNGLGKARREGKLPKLSTAEVLAALAEAPGADAHVVLAPPDVVAQTTAAAASQQQLIPRTIIQTNKSRRIGRRAWSNICSIFELNPGYSYRYYDDARCEALVREHFHPDVLRAFNSLRAGAAIADLWRYCALYVHGGVYLDLDAAIVGPLDASQAAAAAAAAVAANGVATDGGGAVDAAAGTRAHLADVSDDNVPIGPRTQRVFFYDAEANLVQWVLMAAPRDPVLLRCITLSTRRILEREPNIFVATGPSVFTDAFIEEHSGGGSSGSSGVYSSRTSMDWGTRLAFLQRHGAAGEDSSTVRPLYEGYQYADVYQQGEAERYLPTWGSEPTHGLYHPLSIDMLHAAAAAGSPGGDGAGDAGRSDGLSGQYAWSGEDEVGKDEAATITATATATTTTVRWRCILTLSPPPKSRPKGASAAVGVLPIAAANDAKSTTTPVTLPYASARFRCECERQHAGEASALEREVWEYLGAWRRAPGAAHQLHLFEWTPDNGDAAADDAAPACSPTPGGVEAPSVMHVAAQGSLELVGWQGNRQRDDSLAKRLGVARQRGSVGGEQRAAAAPQPDCRKLLQLPIIFAVVPIEP